MRAGNFNLAGLVLFLVITGGSSATATAATFTVTNTNDTGAGSLRQAITSANATITKDQISFNIPGDAPHTIRPTTPLPDVTSPLTLDGWTQPDFAGVPVIELDGSLAGAGNGLTITAGQTLVRGLVVNNFGGGIYGHGIEFRDQGANVIEGCYVGVNANGSAAAKNWGSGVAFFRSANNTIGGPNLQSRNVLSGNLHVGLRIAFSPSTNNLVIGNFLGTDATGTQAVGNGENGLILEDAPQNIIGGADPAARNLVSGNFHGIFIWGVHGSGNVVQGNFVGTDHSGTKRLANRGVGIGVDGSGNLIGGRSSGQGNLVSGNVGQGVNLGGAGATGNIVVGNLIGTDVTGTLRLSNGSGVVMESAPGNYIGGTFPGEGNLISGNDGDGVRIANGKATNNWIRGNFIGTDPTGTKKLGNTGIGLNIINSGANTIGGQEPGSRNVISGNGSEGIALGGTNAVGNIIQGNFIGTDVSGAKSIANFYNGVNLGGAKSNLIGGASPAARNLISGNSGAGVHSFDTNTTDNVISGNFIGTDVTGTLKLGNGNRGVWIDGGSRNRVGGTATGEGNLISGNTGDGVSFTGNARTNEVYGNLIGTDVTGTKGLGNSRVGVWMGTGTGTRVGSAIPGARNVVSGNGLYGIGIEQGGSRNFVQGNFIGVDATGANPLPNTSEGVLIAASSQNLVGGPSLGEGNVIAFNRLQGIRVVSGTNNTLRGNSIWSNGGVGIDLDPAGITQNDSSDTDTGANQRQNFPVLTAVANLQGESIVFGSFKGKANVLLDLDFYGNALADRTGYGEGESLLGSTRILTDVGGNAGFTFTLPTAVPDGRRVTATATDPDGNTSEFSLAVAVGAPDLVPVFIELIGLVDGNDTITMRFVVTNQGNAPAKGLQHFGFGYSSQAIVSSSQAAAIAANSPWPVLNLEPGQSVTITNSFRLPAPGHGTHYFAWQVDSANAVLESVESNNELVVPVKLTASGLRVVLWIGGSGDWNDPTHWSAGALPGPDDDVVIDVPGDVTVTHLGGFNYVKSLRCAELFTLSDGVLAVSTTLEIGSTFTISGGTIRGGVLTTIGGGQVVAKGGILDGVTLGCDLSVNQGTNPAGLGIHNGLTFVGGSTIALDNSDLSFVGSGDANGIKGNGQIRLGTGSMFFGGAVTFGPEVTVVGNGRISGASLTNLGTIKAETPGKTFTLGAFHLTNRGTLSALNGGRLLIQPYSFTNQGNLFVEGASMRVEGPLSIEDSGFVTIGEIGMLQITGSLLGNTRASALYSHLGTTWLTGVGTADSPQLLETMSRDLGNNHSGFVNNFGYGTLSIANTTYVKLVDQSRNSSGTAPEALYANLLVVPPGSTLNLNGLQVYARFMQIEGRVIGGSLTQILEDTRPMIVTQPVGATRVAGIGVSFEVAATGAAPLTYQWRRNGIDLPNATTATLSLNNLTAADSGSYSARVSNAAGVVISRAAQLTVPEPPSITRQPQSMPAVAGDKVRLEVLASGSEPLVYEWQKDGQTIAGQIGSFLEFASARAADAGGYRVIVRNASGVDAVSQTAQVTVIESPVITGHPVGAVLVPDASLTLRVSANGTAPLRYQWRLNGQNLPGQTAATLVIASAQLSDAGLYTVVVANDAGSTTSQPANVRVNVAAAVVGDNFAQATVLPTPTGEASGNNETATVEPNEPLHAGRAGGRSVWFRWRAPADGRARFSTAGSSFDTLLGVYRGSAVNNLTNVVADDDRVSFFASQVTFNAVAGVEYSIALDAFNAVGGDYVLSWSFTANAPRLPEITRQPISQTVLGGGSVTLEVVASGAGLTYQWSFNGVNVPGATLATLRLDAVGRGDVGSYVAAVRNATGDEVRSQEAVVEIGPQADVRSVDKPEFNRRGATATPQRSRRPTALGGAQALAVSFGSAVAQTYSQAGAASQQFETSSCAYIGGRTKWMEVRAEAAGTMFVRVRAGFETALYFRDGQTLTLIASDCASRAHELMVPVRAGAVYWVVTDSVAEGPVDLETVLGSAPRPPTVEPTVQDQLTRSELLLQVPDTALGEPPGSLQWLMDGQALAGANERELRLSVANRIARYSVVVSNALGWVEVPVARVRGTQPLRLSSDLTSLRDATLEIRLEGTLDQGVEVQATRDWTGWERLWSGWLGSDGAVVRDGVGAAASTRFYRAVEREAEASVSADLADGGFEVALSGGRVGERYVLQRQGANGAWLPVATNIVRGVVVHVHDPVPSSGVPPGYRMVRLGE